MKFRKKINHLNFCFTILLMLAHNLAFAKQDVFTPENISILVSSCDKYASFWNPFFKSIERYWPELYTKKRDINIYLIGNKQSYPDNRVQMINIPHELSWSDNMLTALQQIKTKYVLLFLDDYWLTKPVNQQGLNEVLYAMQNEDAAHVELFIESNKKYKMNTPVKNAPYMVYKGQFQNYRTSLQLAIWETQALKQALRSGENIWVFEIAGSIRSSGYPKPFLVIQQSVPIEYLNAAHQGHITPAALAVAKEYDTNFVNTMPILSKYNWRIMASNLKSRMNGMGGMLKRHLLNTEKNAYRYKFDE